MSTKRKTYSATFKAKVKLAVQGAAAKLRLHPLLNRSAKRLRPKRQKHKQHRRCIDSNHRLRQHSAEDRLYQSLKR